MTIKQIFDDFKNYKNKNIKLKVWLVFNRGNNKIRFLSVNDGSTIENLQVVVKKKLDVLEKVKISSALNVEGKINLTPGKMQNLELLASKVEILKNVELDYPIQKQTINLETLRMIPHLRHRTNLFRAIMRIRSSLSQEIHSFFDKNNFLYMHSPIITNNDGEGAGETFIVDSLKHQHFFKQRANLCVTGQLHAEAYALGFGKVYTFGPTFRAELSHTPRHMAEFWMLEPEVAFFSLKDMIQFSQKMLKEVVEKVYAKLPQEFAFLEKLHQIDLKKRITQIVKEDYQILKYQEAIEKINDFKKSKNQPKIKFGDDLNIEDEKILCEKIYQKPVVVIDYPQEIKAFYMKQNDDQKTVACFDLLVPGVGELIGGSERESDYAKLEKRIKILKIDQTLLQWYLDLRHFGYYQSSGFGLGFERLIMFITGIENIRDTIPFPRSAGSLRM